MAVFRRKQNRKNKKAKILCHDKDFGFLCFITLVLKAAKQPLTTARSAGEIKA